MVSQDRLKESLDYDPQTGIFTWVAPTSNRMKVGDIAGTRRTAGYIAIRIYGRFYLAHRLAFIWMTGACPAMVDHVNRDTSDNRWENLRPATASGNSRNTGSRQGSSSKYLGVCWVAAKRKWRVQIKIDGTSRYIGDFKSETEAAKAYDAAAARHYGDFASSNFAGVPSHA